MNILVVDDSMTHRVKFSKCLEGLGHHVCYAIDGAHAMESIDKYLESNNAFNAIFLDINMPRISGMKLIKMLANRRDFDFESTKVVMVTTETTKEFMNDAKELGVYGWMVKPISDDKLKKFVSKLENEDA